MASIRSLGPNKQGYMKSQLFQLTCDCGKKHLLDIKLMGYNMQLDLETESSNPIKIRAGPKFEPRIVV